jgi:hypothetical protein
LSPILLAQQSESHPVAGANLASSDLESRQSVGDYCTDRRIGSGDRPAADLSLGEFGAPTDNPCNFVAQVCA